MGHAALRAPDHCELVPFVFRVVQGEHRHALAELFAAYACEAGKSAESVELERERALRAPVTVALVARLDPGHPRVPAHEQWVCVGGALTNFLNAAHALGYAGKVLSGGKVRSARIARAFCADGEQLVAWIALGTPTREPRTSARDGQVVLEMWTGG